MHADTTLVHIARKDVIPRSLFLFFMISVSPRKI
jgi:hypothetical protein